MKRAMAALAGLCIAFSAHAFDPLRVARDLPPPPSMNLTPMTDANGAPWACPGPRDPASPEIHIEEVIRRALCTDPRTRIAWAGIAARAAERGQVRAEYLPRLDATLSRSRLDQRVTQGGATLDSDVDTDAYRVELGWTLFDFGQRGARADSAEQAMLAALASRDATLQQVFLDAATAYYNLLSAQGSLAVAEEVERINLQGYLAADAKHAAAIGNLTEKLQTQTALGQAILARVQAEGALQEARGRLAVLIGLPPDTPLRLDEDDARLPDTSFVSAMTDMLQKAETRHPELRNARARVEAARAQLTATERAHLPSVRLSASHQNQRIAPSTGGRSDQRDNLVALEVQIPLFDGFGRTYATQAAEAALSEAEGQLEAARRQVAQEVWLAFHALQTGTRTVEKSAELLGFATRSLEVAQGRYKAGIGGTLELLEAQRALADAARQRINALADWRAVRLRLAAALGRLGFWTLAPAAANPS
ncbi:TolC family protein [Nitrogeniibacter aestuarii]|uniref:TolC family protein n=1 Tax=Nitrogeniibacter aestuarii TaxID=2815343 RepID=UPI001D0F8F68|nr:TolC family protein [Nitrogeniibacter aestuarii]